MHHRIITRAVLACAFTAALSYPAHAQTSSPVLREQITAAIGIKPGMIIGEGGAGRGAYTFSIAARVGETGRIYANDINAAALAEIDSLCKVQGVKNITTVVGKPSDPLFPVKNLDMVFLRYVVHHMEDTTAWMKNVIPYMKPGAPLILVEWDAGRAPVPDRPLITEQQLLDIMAKTDFVIDHIDRSFGNDNIYFYKLKQ